MESVVKKVEAGQEEITVDVKTIPEGTIEFFDALDRWVRGAIRMVIEKAINEEFKAFIGCLPYERTPERKDYRNGFLLKCFVPRGRKRFFPSIFRRWQRREKRIGTILSDIFLRGVSTRKIKAISKALWGVEYSPSKVSEFNKSLKEVSLP